MYKKLNKIVVLGLLLAFSLNPSFAQGPGAGAGMGGGESGSVGGSGGSPGGGESSRNHDIYQMAYQALATQDVPGYAIAIVKDGNPVFRATFGMADVEGKKKVTKDTIFGLASLTKTFTAMALLNLVDEGKVKPTDTLDKYLKNIPPSWQKLTIFQLASMRAGLPKSRDDEKPWPEEMAYLEQQPLQYDPDTNYEYSNPSFRILGSVIESVTGMTYLDYISKVILTPLGMTSTGTTETMAPTGRVSCQYVPGPTEWKKIPPKNPMTSYSAGMLAASLDDLCIYANAILQKKILSKAAYKTYLIDRPPLATGQNENWAYGWGSQINKNLGQRVIQMNGGLPGVASTIILLPDSNMTVVALSNLRKQPVYTIARRAMYIYLTGNDINQNQNQDGPGSAAGSSSSGGP